MKATFAALPHVNEIWLTEDGNFHLHPNNGGKRITRAETEKTIPLEVPEPQKYNSVNNNNKPRR